MCQNLLTEYRKMKRICLWWGAGGSVVKDDRRDPGGV